MNAKEKAIFCWSGGKDSALCLHRVLRAGDYEVVCLLTTCNAHFHRVSMHGVRVELLEAQAAAIGLPLEKIFVGQPSTNEEYAAKMEAVLRRYKTLGVETVIFGDIFLEDLRLWRENNLAKIGMRGLFPLWKIDSRLLLEEFVALGFGSILCCVNDAYLDETFAGKKIDYDFLNTLPPHVDPCGENGEYHSFAFAGPIFKQPLRIRVGEKIYRPIEQTHPTSAVCPPSSDAAKRPTQGFWFCELLLEDSPTT